MKRCIYTIGVNPSAPTVLEEFRESWVLPWNLIIPGDGVEQVVLSAKLRHGGLVGNILDIFHWDTGESCTCTSGLSCRKGSIQESPQSGGLCLAAHKMGYKTVHFGCLKTALESNNQRKEIQINFFFSNTIHSFTRAN